MFVFDSIRLALVVAVAIVALAMVALAAVLAVRARTRKFKRGIPGLVGLGGWAETPLAPEGKILVRGELWDARSRACVEAGTAVRVTGVRGLRLLVAPSDDLREQGR